MSRESRKLILINNFPLINYVEMLINIHTHSNTGKSLEIVNFDAFDKTSFFSYGIHPKDSVKLTIQDEIWLSNKCLAIGEIGLDKNIQIPLNKQIEIFKKQLIYSEKLNLPVILHCVKSWNEMMHIHQELQPKQPWIFHGFRKTNLIESVLKNGIYISIGSAVLHDIKLQESIPKIPLNKLFLETDDNKTVNIIDIYNKVALLKNVSLQELTEQIISNFKSVFTRWENG